MDIALLQDRLRTFAAERGWEPFHTPKNLATALGVEVAELAEIFQWLTPEQSTEVAGDALLKDRVGEEAADVLLYLVQLCDHAGVELDAAVEDKLVKNARRHPPTEPGRAAALRSRPVRRVYALVDWENVQPRDDELRAAVPGVTHVWLFQGAMQRAADASYGSFGERVVTVPVLRTGKNALDFHLTFYIGYIAARHPDAGFVVVSNDQGYAPMIAHACELGFDVRQVGFSRSASAASSSRRRGAGSGTAKKASAGTAKPAPAKQVAGKVATRTVAADKGPAGKAAAGKATVEKAAPRKATAKKAAGRKPAAEPPAQPEAPGALEPAKKSRRKAASAKVVTRKAAKTAPEPAPNAAAKSAARTAAKTARTPAEPAPKARSRARVAPAPPAPVPRSPSPPPSPPPSPRAASAAAPSTTGALAMALMAEPAGRRSPTRKGLLRFVRRQLGDAASEAAVQAALDALQAARIVELQGDAVRYLR